MKPIKKEQDFIVPNFDFMNEMTMKISNDLNSQIETAIIEALKLKGFEFENRIELENFIKQRCKCEDNIDLKERTYYVDDKPFFLHMYKPELEIKKVLEDRNVTFSASYGKYRTL